MEEAQGASKDTGIAALTHVLGLFAWFVGPLAVYLVKSDDRFVKENAANALNWQISFTIYSFVAALLILVFIGALILPVLGLLNIVFCVIAALKASEGEAWSYPITIDLV